MLGRLIQRGMVEILLIMTGVDLDTQFINRDSVAEFRDLMALLGIGGFTHLQAIIGRFLLPDLLAKFAMTAT
ncbi:MAG: hypothetical protein CMM23_10540 [Rhodospirillaceae bacterium]|nr:hypothetical protein [Rhodospirillaceae bacterium]|tara:strand:- start:10612 stop:10827 length:216 start_codon:yes stop_codon:yes gene_type:complete